MKEWHCNRCDWEGKSADEVIQLYHYLPGSRRPPTRRDPADAPRRTRGTTAPVDAAPPRERRRTTEMNVTPFFLYGTREERQLPLLASGGRRRAVGGWR